MTSGSGLTRAVSLEEAVEVALHADPVLARSPIGVAVQGTTVSLTGAVGSAVAKETAEQLARRVAGVLEVTNELLVHHAGASGPFGDAAASGVGIAVLAGGIGASRMGGGGGAGGLGAVAALEVMAAAHTEASDEHGHEDGEEVKG